MFSQESVILSTVEGRGRAWQRGACMVKETCVVGGGACMAGETATAADGTHPTGMHSCFGHAIV